MVLKNCNKFDKKNKSENPSLKNSCHCPKGRGNVKCECHLNKISKEAEVRVEIALHSYMI